LSIPSRINCTKRFKTTPHFRYLSTVLVVRHNNYPSHASIFNTSPLHQMYLKFVLHQIHLTNKPAYRLLAAAVHQSTPPPNAQALLRLNAAAAHASTHDQMTTSLHLAPPSLPLLTLHTIGNKIDSQRSAFAHDMMRIWQI
jgi:hypothetical protein